MMATASEAAIIPDRDDEKVQEINSVDELCEIVREGGELITDSSDVAHALEAGCGFEIKERSEDGLEFILQVKGENNDLLPEPIEVDMETVEEGSGNFKSGRGPTAPKQTVLGEEFKIDSEAVDQDPKSTRYVAFSSPDQKVHALIKFQPTYTRPSTEGHERVDVGLGLKEAQFGVEGCLQTSKCLGHFVHRVESKFAQQRCGENLPILAQSGPAMTLGLCTTTKIEAGKLA